MWVPSAWETPFPTRVMVGREQTTARAGPELGVSTQHLGMVPLAGHVPWLIILSIRNGLGLPREVKGIYKSKLLLMQMKSEVFFSSQLPPIWILAEVVLNIRAESLLWCVAKRTFCWDTVAWGWGVGEVGVEGRGLIILHNFSSSKIICFLNALLNPCASNLPSAPSSNTPTM